MSNFCATAYHFEGEKECLRDFYEKLQKIQGDESVPDYRKRCWMTRLAAVFGLNPDDYYCRGYFMYPEMAEDGSSLGFDVESGNCPCEDLIEAIMKYYQGKLSVLWFVECPDDGEYFTNDAEGRIFSSRYEVELEDIDNEWFDTIEEAIAWIHSKTGIKIPESIYADRDKLYEYITDDLEEQLDMCCNFHWVEVLPQVI